MDYVCMWDQPLSPLQNVSVLESHKRTVGRAQGLVVDWGRFQPLSKLRLDRSVVSVKQWVTLGYWHQHTEAQVTNGSCSRAPVGPLNPGRVTVRACNSIWGKESTKPRTGVRAGWKEGKKSWGRASRRDAPCWSKGTSSPWEMCQESRAKAQCPEPTR